MKATPRVTARLAGAMYLISAVPAGFSVFVLQKLFVRSDPVATATHILDSENLFRLGFACDLIGIMLVIGSTLFLYELFKPVSRRLALLMLSFCLIGSTIQALNSLQDLSALILLKGGASMAALTTDQAQTLAFVFVRLHALTYDLALAFFGIFSLSMGGLALKSTFIPRVLGVLMVCDGLGFLTFSFSTLLAPAFAARMYPYIPLVTALFGEMLLMLWLVVRGVDARRWEQQASAAAG